MRGSWPVLTAVFLAAACGGSDRTVERSPESDIVVASFDFAESQLVAEIYAQALEGEGFVVARQLGLGPREVVIPALRQGFVDLVPEYAGSALAAFAPGSSTDPGDVHDVVDQLAAAIAPWGLEVLSSSPASNRNELAVTAFTATNVDLWTISDLGPFATSMIVGGPPECPVRRHCLVGLADVYGLEFGSFVPLADAGLVRRALLDGVIDVGVVFSTDAALAGSALVVLEDDEGLQPADHVVPVVRREALDDRVAAVLDGVSAQLTTTNLRFLNWRVANAGAGIAAEARGWLVRHALVDR
jgi:osmoprotectant transport system substrate-binding protein